MVGFAQRFPSRKKESSVPDTQPAPAGQHGKPPLLWVQTTVFATTFLIAAIGVPWYAMAIGFEWSAIVGFFVFSAATGMSITAGYHRLWAHNAYRAHVSLRVLFALFGAAAVQNSILSWVTGHRRHHRYVDDNDRDPYSAGRGLWFSHMGWMLRHWPSGAEDRSNVKDLMRDPVVVWQDRHYVPIAWTMNVTPPVLVGVMTGDLLANLLLMGVARLVITHHTTFFINSLAHFWGRQPFSDGNSARDNGVLALFTYGEGFHNFHHRFQTDYRNGIRWFDYDPTKWLIRAAAWLGLASDLRRVDRFRIREAQVAMQLKRAEAALPATADADKWREVLEQESAYFTQCLEQWRHLKHELDELGGRIAAHGRDLRHSANEQLRYLEQALKEQLQRLNSLHLQMELAR
jgi:stearoyl-CoA desaturase (delta-9 desaturase)